MKTYEDSYWSTPNGLNIIGICHELYRERGFNACIKFCHETNNMQYVPVFEEINRKNNPETLKKRNKLKRYWKKVINPKSFPQFIKRKCKDCGKIRYCQWQHSFTQTGKPEYRARCVACRKIYLKKLNKKNRKILNQQKIQRARITKQKCVDYLGGKCIKCGYNKSLYGLTFHHKNPKKKINTVAVMIQNLSFKNKKLIKELNKCELLCFNCHMELRGETNGNI